MTDEAYEEWESVSEEFGTKIEWNVGTRFIGQFTGVRKDIDLGDGEVADAAEFTKDGEKFYSWIPYALAQVIESGKLIPGDICMIECKREDTTKRGLNKVKVFDIKVKPRN